MHSSTRLCLHLLSGIVIPLIANAHPMGNFSINHYSRLTVEQKSVEILYVIDRAEIPAYQEIRQFNIVPRNGDPTVAPYLLRQAELLSHALHLDCDGNPVKLAVISRHAEFLEGAGGLPTLAIQLRIRGKIPAAPGPHMLSYADNNFPGRAGWKEMIVTSGDGITIQQSSAPKKDRSQELTVYSSDLLSSPPQQVSASATFVTVLPPPNLVSRALEPANRVHSGLAKSEKRAPANTPVTVLLKPALPEAAPAAPKQTRTATTPRNRFTDLISTQERLSLWVLLSAALIAAGLGALHALEPGHGKTIVGAYLVGSQGTAAHAVLLGLVVTAAHTSSVFALGAITLYASRYIVPDQLYPWLGALSGVSVVVLGIYMLLRHLTGNDGDHSHAEGTAHSHWLVSFFTRRLRAPQRGAQQNSKEATGGVSLRQLIALGITGGLVPCPAALVVLLSAFSLHRIGFGMFLITAFSAGLAAVLVTIGLVMVYTKRFVSSYFRPRASFSRYLPLFSSAFMVLIGAGIAYSAIASIPASQTVVSKQAVVPFVSIVLLGLFLGMRHSTDSDHVVAVSTLVSRQGSIRGSAAIGLLWGLGHTITIFLVGTAIIVFGIVIPPRLGLFMEFCVALMLILLGALNLTGVLSKITARFSQPGQSADSNREQSSTSQKLGTFHTVRPLFVGLVHGLAGSAAVALLVLSTIRNPFLASGYLIVFGAGTMLGMMLMTAAISMPLVYAKARFKNITGHLTFISGLGSVAFGIFLVFQIGFIDGLFRSQVHWIAH